MNKIIIVGGGSAGWMTASTLIREFPDRDITLIESPNIQITGVGESTTQLIYRWIEWLGIDLKDFVPYTDAAFKLSIRFEDFYKKGEFYHYPFGETDITDNLAGINDWWFRKILKPNTLNSEYADCMCPTMALVNSNKFDPNARFGFHFDAVRFGLWLRDNYCIPRGVKHIKEDISSIQQDDNGIVSLNNKYSADLYIDCTGFKSLLLSETLKEPFISYEDMLPNNSSWATRVPYTNKEKELTTYTNCTAIENGWVWNTPTWSRMGAGYVYSDKFVDDDTALKEFKNHLGREDLEFKKIKMRVGIHKRLWVKNVVAIGLSAGFIEPLEANGLFSVHEFLNYLIRNMQREKVSTFDKDNFTYACRQEFENFAEFVALHYALSHRDDTEYWRANFNKTWCNKVIERIPSLTVGINSAIKDRAFDFSHSPDNGLHYIAAGNNWAPTDKLSLIQRSNLDDMDGFLKVASMNMVSKKQKWINEAEKFPSLYQYLKENYYNA